MALHIEIDDKHYKSDAIDNGRVVKRFFGKLSRIVFNDSYRYFKEYKAITGSCEDIPLVYPERNLYSVFSSAVSKITPVHISEYSFNKSDNKKLKNSRRVDLWCLDKASATGKPINYFIEIKKAWYCLNERSKEDLNKSVENRVYDICEQLRALKKIKPNWEGVDDVFLGLIVIHGYYSEGKEHFNQNHVVDNIRSLVDKRQNAQLLFSTWMLPDDMSLHRDKGKCRFVSLACIVITKKRRKE